MKQPLALTAAWLLAATLNLHAQGSLTPPPGAPAPVMKTLDQIEARTPVNSTTCPGDATATYIIIAPGSYYLTNSIGGNPGKVGIRVEAVNVTIDLNGFNLQAAAGATKGIYVTSSGGPIVIRNGFMRFWTEPAIYIPNASEFTIQDVTITNVTGRGIDVAGSGTIERVNIKYAVDSGIFFNVASGGIVRDCRVENITGTTVARGIYAPKALITGCTVTGITGSSSGASNTVAGISCAGGNVNRCLVQTVTQQGGGTASGVDQAASVSHTAVSQITSSAASSTNGIAGISACDEVSFCSISAVSTASHYCYGVSGAGNVVSCNVKDITSTSGSSVGISGNSIRDCTVKNMPNGTGLECTIASKSLIDDCASGIHLSDSGSATGNTVKNAKGSGIQPNGNNIQIIGNNLEGTGVAGSYGISYNTLFQYIRIEGNHVSGWGTGLNIPVPNALVVRNSAGGNTVNFTLHASMPVVTGAALGTNPNANVGF